MSETTAQNASVRIRINHSRTAKAGWQHETTVEIAGPLHTSTARNDENAPYLLSGIGLNGYPDALLEDIGTVLSRLLTDVDTIGREESARRNALDQEGIPA